MSGDVHVRFCERLGVQLPRATHLIVHCRSKREADLVRQTVATRLRECGLTLHPEKTRVVYCKDSNRRESHPHEQFDFLGFTFRLRKATTRRGGLFCSLVRPSR
jgi:RNA-directed DNA polymerase